MNASEILGQLMEELAAIEREWWSHWQKYLHSKGLPQPDGSLLLPPDLVRKWEKQFSTAYGQLSEEEKQSDRDQVARYLPVITAALGACVSDLPR
jgi:hypothetical protein